MGKTYETVNLKIYMFTIMRIAISVQIFLKINFSKKKFCKIFENIISMELQSNNIIYTSAKYAFCKDDR